MTAAASARATTAWAKCRLCAATLADGDDRTTGVCRYCQTRPEVRRLASDKPAARSSRPASAPALAAVPAGPPTFTPGERSLIKSMAEYLPAGRLLEILNERVTADRGPTAPLHTLEQLQTETRGAGFATATSDWAGLRRLLAEARASGLLDSLTTTTIEDFAVVYQLAPAQALHLKDVIRHAQDGAR